MNKPHFSKIDLTELQVSGLFLDRYPGYSSGP